MLSEEFYSSIGGPPITANTAIAKDVGVYAQSITPSYAVKSTFKKSSTGTNSLAVGETHVFAAQNEKSQLHVYSRLRGNQETTVTFPERIRSIALIDDVLALGTTEGRLILWEICTGRQVTTPPCHVQPITCLATTGHHVLTGSEDSNIHVWALSHLLELHSTAEYEPQRTLSHHRGAITSLVVGQSQISETSICISASKDKTCIIWNYQTGDALRTLLFPTAPLCISLDPCARAVFVSSEDRSLYLVEMFGDKPLIGPRSAEISSTVVQITAPIGIADSEAGPASCLACSYDGTILLSGHTKGKILQWQLSESGHASELADLNASVTNLIFPPLLRSARPTKAFTIVKPTQAERQYTFTSQLETDLGAQTRFDKMLIGAGFPGDVLEKAILAFQEPAPQSGGDQELQKQNEELWEIINEQRALQKTTLQRYVEAKSGGT